MAEPRTYNFDDEDVSEYFTFKVKGHVYRFKHLTTDELDELRYLTKKDNKLNKDDDTDAISDKANEFLNARIEKADPEAKDTPEWAELEKKLITPLRTKIQLKIVAEMTGNAKV